MKMTYNILTTMLMLVFLTASAFAQGGTVTPVYIPGTDLDVTSAVKTVSTSTTKKATSASYSKPSSSIVTTPTNSDSNLGGCGCDGGGCDSCSGCDGGCSSSCGCGRRDRIGRSFFGRVRNLIPINVTVNGGDCGCGDSDCDSCQGDCGCDSGWRRFLPISFRLRTNHCCRYIGVFGGYVDLEDYDGNLAGNTRLIEFNGGWQFGIKRGKIFANGIRMESEFSYRHNTNDSYSLGNFVGQDFVATSTFDSIDSVYQLTSMTNFLYDFRNSGRTTPYVGFGAGGVYADGDIITPALGQNDSIEDYAFAYQLIVGASRQINSNATGFVEYKYFGSSGVEVENAGMAVGEFDLQSNNVIFGIRWKRPR